MHISINVPDGSLGVLLANGPWELRTVLGADGRLDTTPIANDSGMLKILSHLCKFRDNLKWDPECYQLIFPDGRIRNVAVARVICSEPNFLRVVIRRSNQNAYFATLRWFFYLVTRSNDRYCLKICNYLRSIGLEVSEFDY